MPSFSLAHAAASNIATNYAKSSMIFILFYSYSPFSGFALIIMEIDSSLSMSNSTAIGYIQ